MKDFPKNLLPMVSVSIARKMALSFPEAEEKSHFERPDFRIKKKIFATLHEKDKRMVLKFSIADQSVFCKIDKAIIYPVAGGWGRKGWTFVELKRIKKEQLHDALLTAWKTVAPITLRKKHFPQD